MKILYREYENKDYKQCEQLVNKAWSFDKIFNPRQLSNLAKLLYTKGSIVNSNYKRVMEIDKKVVGFIFGINQNIQKPKRNILFGLKIFFKFLFVKATNPDKKSLLTAISEHEKNKINIIGKNRSEIVLFVIDEEYQGKGYGKKLYLAFKDFCMKSKVDSIVVETNLLGASDFYKKIGFKHLENFDSPLHEIATKGGQSCIYEFKLSE